MKPCPEHGRQQLDQLTNICTACGWQPVKRRQAPRSRKRLPQKPTLELDEKLVNLLRYYQLFDDATKKPMKPIELSSCMGEMNAIEEMIVERLQWLFSNQFPREKFIWGAIKSFRKLPDKMPMKLQHAFKRYKERNGL